MRATLTRTVTERATGNSIIKKLSGAKYDSGTEVAKVVHTQDEGIENSNMAEERGGMGSKLVKPTVEVATRCGIIGNLVKKSFEAESVGTNNTNRN